MRTQIRGHNTKRIFTTSFFSNTDEPSCINGAIAEKTNLRRWRTTTTTTTTRDIWNTIQYTEKERDVQKVLKLKNKKKEDRNKDTSKRINNLTTAKPKKEKGGKGGMKRSPLCSSCFGDIPNIT